MFWTKAKPNKESIENPTLSDEIRSIKAKISRIETEILDLAQGQALIRDKIMRKIRLKTQDQDDDPDQWAGIPLK